MPLVPISFVLLVLGDYRQSRVPERPMIRTLTLAPIGLTGTYT